MTFKGSVYYWVPAAFPIIPWYSWPFGWSSVSLTLSDTALTISGWWPSLSRGWRGPYSEIERVDPTWLGLRFVFKKDSAMTFRTREQENLVRALMSHGIQIGMKAREVG